MCVCTSMLCERESERERERERKESESKIEARKRSEKADGVDDTLHRYIFLLCALALRDRRISECNANTLVSTM